MGLQFVENIHKLTGTAVVNLLAALVLSGNTSAVVVGACFSDEVLRQRTFSAVEQATLYLLDEVLARHGEAQEGTRTRLPLDVKIRCENAYSQVLARGQAEYTDLAVRLRRAGVPVKELTRAGPVVLPITVIDKGLAIEIAGPLTLEEPTGLPTVFSRLSELLVASEGFAIQRVTSSEIDRAVTKDVFAARARNAMLPTGLDAVALEAAAAPSAAVLVAPAAASAPAPPRLPPPRSAAEAAKAVTAEAHLDPDSFDDDDFLEAMVEQALNPQESESEGEEEGELEAEAPYGRDAARDEAEVAEEGPTFATPAQRLVQAAQPSWPGGERPAVSDKAEAEALLQEAMGEAKWRATPPGKRRRMVEQVLNDPSALEAYMQRTPEEEEAMVAEAVAAAAARREAEEKEKAAQAEEEAAQGRHAGGSGVQRRSHDINDGVPSDHRKPRVLVPSEALVALVQERLPEHDDERPGQWRSELMDTYRRRRAAVRTAEASLRSSGAGSSRG